MAPDYRNQNEDDSKAQEPLSQIVFPLKSYLSV